MVHDQSQNMLGRRHTNQRQARQGTGAEIEGFGVEGLQGIDGPGFGVGFRLEFRIELRSRFGAGFRIGFSVR